MRALIMKEAPALFVSSSSEILPEIFEHDRMSTTVINAVLGPLITTYVRELDRSLRAEGYRGDVLLLHSGGGVMTAQTATRLPARLAASGLAAGAIASRVVAGAGGFENSIGLDMGGTSTDISLVHEGEGNTTKRWYVEWGHPICFPSLDVRTIGAGGGSIAWIDDGGSLRSGPQSAGARPGPACYKTGGEAATTTDANLVLGRLGSKLLGGAMSLDVHAAESAIGRHVASHLGMDVEEAARAVIQVANANMADAVRVVSIRRGHDPREFVLVAFGGAGPLHGAALARELGIPRVLVPPYPGITSALGCLLVDVRHDLSAMFFGLVTDVDTEEMEERFQALESEARQRLDTEGVPENEMHLRRMVDMRYVGQWRSLSIPCPSPITSLASTVSRFHVEHEREHHYRRDSAAVEIYQIGVVATGAVIKPSLPRYRSTGRRVQLVPRFSRQVIFDDATTVSATPVYWRTDLPVGATIAGPAVIEQLDSTTLVPPDVVGQIDEWGNILLEFGQ
jgi:N-methylhydantoinase A